jgi:hypothetical protein
MLISLIDAADLPPKFVEPSQSMFKTDHHDFIYDLDDGYILFYENLIGPVFNIKALSSNQQPLGSIRYKLIMNDKKGSHFEIRQHESNGTWFLNCKEKFFLDHNGREEFVRLTIRAIESEGEDENVLNYRVLFTDRKIVLKIVNGDLCAPKFDKDLYEFSIVENIRDLISPIYVEDCDKGVNGQILLETTNPDFEFKLDRVHYQSKLGIQMLRMYDYEDANLKSNGHKIEFDIIARGTNESTNRHETRARIRVAIKDLNEFVPKFIKPEPIRYMRDGVLHTERLHTYRVPENQDFHLDVKAIDEDESNDSKSLIYLAQYINKEDTFEIQTRTDSESDMFKITIPGKFLDSNSKLPIMFSVRCKDNSESILYNEIIVMLRPQSSELKPVYFEFKNYEFDIVENRAETFNIKLINDNLEKTRVILKKINDPLNIISIDYADSSILTLNDETSLAMNQEILNIETDDVEVNTELVVSLGLSDKKLDLDSLFMRNKSDLYTISLEASVNGNENLSTKVFVHFKFVDSNDNQPRALLENNHLTHVEATLDEDFVLNTMINMDKQYKSLVFQDLDFSEEYGVRSLYFELNDTRFEVNNEFISSQLESLEPNEQKIEVQVRVRVGHEFFNIRQEPVVWLNLTCQDNYFNRRFKRDNSFWTESVLIRLSLVPSPAELMFDKDLYFFDVKENWNGFIGKINSSISSASYELTPSSLFELRNSNELYLVKNLDYEHDEKLYNLNATAKYELQRVTTQVVVYLKDTNDNLPIFSQQFYEFNPSKFEKGVEIGTVYASDLDTNDLDNLVFEIEEQYSHLFRVNRFNVGKLQGFRMFLNTNDLSGESLLFKIIVRDTEGQSSTAQVSLKKASIEYKTFKWLDANDEQVVDVLKIRSSKESLSNKPITKVRAVIDLENETKEKKVVYKLIANSGPFSIDENTGELFVTDASLLGKQRRYFINVQAELKLDSRRKRSLNNEVVVSSEVITILLELSDSSSERIAFITPANNKTIIRLNAERINQQVNENTGQVEFFKVLAVNKEPISYSIVDERFVALEEELFVYEIGDLQFDESTKLFNFTNKLFKINETDGNLSLDFNQITAGDFVNLLKLSSNKNFIIRLSLRAVHSAETSNSINLYVNLKLDSLNDLFKHVKMPPVRYVLEPNDESLKRVETDNDMYKFKLNESIRINTIVARLKAFVDETELKTPVENLRIASSESNDLNAENAELYFNYDQMNGNVKLIRKLNYEFIKHIAFNLVEVESSSVRARIEIVIDDVNDQEPSLEIDEYERLNGENLMIVSVGEISEVQMKTLSDAISSTPPNRLAPFPNLTDVVFNPPEFPTKFPTIPTPELDSNLRQIRAFRNLTDVKSYRIIDPDMINNFSVSFIQNETDPTVLELYDVRINGSFVVFSKKPTSNTTTVLDSKKNSFKIRLSDGVFEKVFSGEVVQKELEELKQILVFYPINGRYETELFRSSVSGVKLNLNPRIKLKNPLPFNYYLKLDGPHAKYFYLTQNKVTPNKFNPFEPEIGLLESLSNHEATLHLGTLNLNLKLISNNSYINSLLETLGDLNIKIKLINDNKYQPKITMTRPQNRIINLKENTYVDEKIAEIKATDQDHFDSDRIEYFLIGSSYLLRIDRFTGEIFLNGTLDAESEKSIKFYAYSRDMAPEPFGMSSESVEFVINITDVNEFLPVIVPSATVVNLKENESNMREVKIECYDRDVDSKLAINLNSVQYVNVRDTSKFVEDIDWHKANRHRISDFFKLRYDENNSQLAYLTLVNRIDYESLFRPNETMIRVDLECTDGLYHRETMILVKVEDLNDNQPRFAEKHLILRRNESNTREVVAKIQAYDMDLSPNYGNQSLIYSIVSCTPNDTLMVIDSKSGVLRVEYGFDIDKTNTNLITCNVHVNDSYGMEASLGDNMKIDIHIDGINDNTPEIMMDKYEFSILEGDTSIGKLITKIKVVDLDGASGLKCIFTNNNLNSPYWDVFEFKTEIDPNDSRVAYCLLQVQANSIVRYDVIKRSELFIILTVVDDQQEPVFPNKGHASIEFKIRVKNINKPPMFVNGKEETFYVLDSIRPGQVVGTLLATDLDNLNPTQVTYQIANEDIYKDSFELVTMIPSTIGNQYWASTQLRTKSKLDVNLSPYVLLIIAKDSSNSGSYKTVKVFVLNKGSMSVWINVANGKPVDYYSAEINEETNEDELVLTVKASIPNNYSDKNSELDIVVEYSLDEPNPYYTIDAKSGEIRTTMVKIDFEEKDSIKMKQMRTIRVRANSTDGFYSYLTHVSVNVVDINDNQPQFINKEVYRFYVPENTTEHLRIGQVKAIDLDSDLNGQVVYKLDDDRKIFEVDEMTGVISLINGVLIDREQNETVRLRVIAQDQGSPQQFNTTLDLELVILDINDNEPVIQRANLKEVYEIEENTLNFEIQLAATDIDNGPNGTVFFYLDKNSNNLEAIKQFSINPLTGLITLNSPLDYEKETSYQLTVLCSDNGKPMLDSAVTLNINVIDLNDNRPVFDQNATNWIQINEHIKHDEHIATIRAFDADKSDEFRQIQYEINGLYAKTNDLTIEQLENSGLFKYSEGVLRFGDSQTLNHSALNEYIIELKVYDQNAEDLFSLFNLTVVVLPSNDKLPEFEKPNQKVTLFKRSLIESQPNDYLVDIVKAFDPNRFGIRYNIEEIFEIRNETETRLDDLDLFKIDSDDGIIRATRSRSSYLADSYRLVIKAQSKLNETLFSKSNFFVNIDNMNDSLFDSRLYELNVDENISINRKIFQLVPKVNKNLHYKINEKYSTIIGSKWFKLNEMIGILFTNSDEIDYEKNSQVILSVDVFESSELIENLILKIDINDLNDNKPVFDLAYNYEPQIFEDDKQQVDVERLITKFKAVDLDGTEANSRIEYKIESVSRPFKTNQFKLVKSDENDEVSLVKLAGTHLDRDDHRIQNSVTFKVIAEDNPDNVAFKLKSEMTIALKLKDLNDNQAVITNNMVSSINVFESQKLFEPFFTVQAVDVDDGANSALNFDLSDPTRHVAVDKNGGLYLRAQLDYEKIKKFNVTLRIFDDSPRPLYTTKEYQINVLNVNDNLPKLIMPNNKNECELSVNEGQSSLGKLVHKFNAIDADETEKFSFEIIEIKAKTHSNEQIVVNANLFDLNKRNGELTLNQELDREQIESYTMQISLKDEAIGDVQLETKFACTIHVLDVNDNAPSFLNTVSEFKILPIINQTTFINWFGAVDIDLGMNGSVEYLIESGDRELFEINNEGYLYMNMFSRNLKNRPLFDVYELKIVAMDKGSPQRLNSSLEIIVKIDPNYFKFSQKSNDKLYFKDNTDIVYINENLANGSLVTQVSLDNSFDSVMHENEKFKIELKYKLLTMNDTFSIDDGFVRVIDSSKLDFEKNKEFLLLIEAVEIQNLAKSVQRRHGLSRLVVKLNNLNDNVPQFSQNVYEFNLDENQSTRPFEFKSSQIKITDADLSDGASQALNQLEANDIDLRLNGSDSNFFRIVKKWPLFYKLEALNIFDYEFKSKYEFEVVVFDGYHRNTCKIVVNVNDLNDNRPIFEKSSYQFAVDENSAKDTLVGQVKAIDLDGTEENQRIYYKILNTKSTPGALFKNDQVSEPFDINFQTGELFVNNNLDRESVQSYNLTIIAYNPNNMSMSDMCTVHIKINDLNDNAPKFNEPFFLINLREKSKHKRLIAKLKAVDYDLEENSTVSYKITTINGFAADSLSEFLIDSKTGFVYLNQYLDLDKTLRQDYEIKVVALDKDNQQDDCLILVKLVDINDNEPKVTSPESFDFEYDENKASLELFQLSAIDPDYSNRRLKYTIESDLNNDWSYFTINENNWICAKQMFDFESKRNYRFKISITDSGLMVDQEKSEPISTIINDNDFSYEHNLTSTIEIKIRINDLDDNEPEFVNNVQPFEYNVSHNLPIGSKVAVLPIAVDRDSEPANTKIRYYILSGNEENKFKLDEVTGDLVLNDEIEIQIKSTYELLVKATSRSQFVFGNVDLNNSTVLGQDKSVIRVVVNFLPKEMTIEFDQPKYFVSVQTHPDSMNTSSIFKEFNFDRSNSRSLKMDESYLNRLQKSSIFYSRAHLKQRKLKRTLEFNVEMLQILRANQKSAQKLSIDLIKSVDSHQTESERETDEKHLFFINKNNGKVYLNRLRLTDFQVGDKFILSISAISRSKLDSSIEDNTITELHLRLTQQDFNFILSIKGNLDKMIFNYLNPLHNEYIARIIEADGVRIAVQDLVEKKAQSEYDLVLQLSSNIDHEQAELKSFIEFWKNFSASNAYLKNFNFIDKQPVPNAVHINPEDMYESTPFYYNWLFWLLSLISVLLIIILIIFVICIKLTKKDKKKNPGIIIEYPPGINPIYQNGVLKLNNNNKSVKKSRVTPVSLEQSLPLNYEEQVLEMDLPEDEEEEDARFIERTEE